MRYLLMPNGWQSWDDDQPVTLPNIQVEPTQARPTGLLNASGQQIWVSPDPIGFRFQDNNPNAERR